MSEQQETKPAEEKVAEKTEQQDAAPAEEAEAADKTPEQPPKEMRAVVLTGFGGLKSVKVLKKPEPTLGEGEVLIRVKAWLEWLGHVIRMNDQRIPKKILNTKPEGRRNIGRQKLRWLDGVEDDLRTLGVRRWRQKALVGQEWTKILREAKARLQGPYRHGCYTGGSRSRESVEVDPRSGRPVTATSEEIVETIHDMVLNDNPLKVREISEVMRISAERVHHILVS
ncbi:hypothetical protein ANN_01970 [Periplaneta americana]|uniref:Uncharacterized protein n=1 Tax=Periplaneta americana TaxID=6978 RepID=A0ABQ8TXG6_PERAM|nr:hypothetical protein ANN_01970 [Periplaneta americana]